jgi:hypothetical protein
MITNQTEEIEFYLYKKYSCISDFSDVQVKSFKIFFNWN